MDKFDVIAHTIERLNNRMKTLHSEYLSEELDDLLYTLKKPEWQLNCRMTRFDNCYQLIDSLHFNGTGVQVYGDGDIYIGTFNQNNKRDGEGAYLFPNGDVYFGPWENGHRSGQGYYEFRNGKHERVVAEAPVTPAFVYNRSESFWQRLFSDKILGRLDFLLSNILLTMLVVLLAYLFPLIMNIINLEVYPLHPREASGEPLIMNIIILGAGILWLMLYVKRCRDCGFNFFVGLLLLIISPLTLLVFIWPGKYVSVAPVSSSSSRTSVSTSDNLPLSAKTSDLSKSMRNRAKVGIGEKDDDSSHQKQIRKQEDDPYSQNHVDEGRAQQERAAQLLKQKEEDDRRKQSEENLRQRDIDRIKYDYEDARRKYEMAKKDMEIALTQAQTVKSYAEDEERKAREYDDESALGRAREYHDSYAITMDEVEKAKREAEEYEKRMETYRNRLALLKEYI